MLLETAHEIAKEYHAGDVDIAGVDYYEGHLTTVAATVVGDDVTRAVAVLHDVIEDTEMTEFTLRGLLDGYKEADVVVDAVVAVTKVDGESYGDYIARVMNNPIARAVKVADMKHNSDLGRLPSVSTKDIARAEKYEKYLKILGA